MQVVLDALLERLTASGLFRQEEGSLVLSEFKPQSNDEEERIRKEIVSRLEKGGFAPPDKTGLLAGLPPKQAAQALQALLKMRRVLKLEECHFPVATLQNGEKILRQYLSAHPGDGTVSNLRQLLNTSRKYALPLLNYYEAQGLLVRKGDLRVLA